MLSRIGGVIFLSSNLEVEFMLSVGGGCCIDPVLD